MKAVLTGVVLAMSAVRAYAQPGMGGSIYYGGYPIPYSASTVEEGYVRGVGELFKDKGIYNQLTAQAARDLAQANTITIDNARKWVQTYFDVRQLNREERTAERGPAPSLSFLMRSAQEAAPRRLSAYELDATTGQINWPVVLQAEIFARQRAQLEQLFATRATGPRQAAAFDTFIGIWQGADRLLDALQSYISYLPPQEYVAAKRFLQSLAWEASQPMVPVAKDRAVGSLPLSPPAVSAVAPPRPDGDTTTAARAVQRE